jgi:arsenate reductase (thioredoxin)
MFVSRFAREGLRAVTQTQAGIAKELPEVLFVCVHNAGRSQMTSVPGHLASGGPRPFRVGC